jgi:hypothetical protein
VGQSESRCGGRDVPLLRRLGSEEAESAAGDEVALKGEGVVDGQPPASRETKLRSISAWRPAAAK